mgnify:FL=1
MEKKNTGLIVLVVVLSLLVVGLGGYIVYDKMLDKNINDSDNKGKNDNIIDKNDKNEVAKINETIVVDINNDKTYNKDINNHNVYVDDKKINLTNKEYELLLYLIKNKNIVLTREQILNNVWNMDYLGEERTIDTHIKTLRSLLGKYKTLIVTVRGVGYKFEENELV